MMIRPLLVAGIATTALVLGACSDGSSDSKSAEAQIEETMQAFTDAVNNADADQYIAQICAQYADDFPVDELSQQLVFVKAFAGELTFEISNIKVDGDKATADVKVTAANDDHPDPAEQTDFVKEDGDWKVCKANGDMMGVDETN